MSGGKDALHMAAWWLLILGGINWGLALFHINLVTAIFGTVPILVTITYAAIGLSAVVMLVKSSGMMKK